MPRVLLGSPSTLPAVLTRESTFRFTFVSPQDLEWGFARWRSSVITNRTRDRGPTDSFMKTCLILTEHPLPSEPSESLCPTVQPSRCLSPSCHRPSVMEPSLSWGFKELLRSRRLSLGCVYFLVVNCAFLSVLMAYKLSGSLRCGAGSQRPGKSQCLRMHPAV